MRKKQAWTVNENDYYSNYYNFNYNYNNNNNRHYFQRDEKTNVWNEILEKTQLGRTTETILDTFKLKTFDTNSLILYSDNSGQHLELSEDKAKLAFGFIERLERVVDFYTGYWMDMDTDILRKKRETNDFIILE